MKTKRKTTGSIMRKYYQLMLIIICFVSVVTLLIYRHEYYRLRYVLEVLNFFGKPGLSEIEFCGPGFNATLLTEIMRNSSMEVRETPPLFQQVDENFYIYSSFARAFPERGAESYRGSTKQGILVDTLAVGKENQIPNFSCKIWVGDKNSHKPGKFSYKVVREAVSGLKLYVFKCSVNVKIDRANGVSYYTNNYSLNPYHAPVSKLIKISDKHKKRQDSRIRFVNNVKPAICVIPNRVPIVTSDDLMTFIVFHYTLGVKYFTVYDSMVTNDIVKRLNLIPNDIKPWDLQIYPLNYPFMAKSNDILRYVIELDCIFRHFRLDSDDSNNVSHLMVMSWDEYLVPRVHVDLKSVLDDYDPLRKVSSIEVSPLLFCTNQPNEMTNEESYPVIFKKTHYYTLPHDFKSIFIYNLDTLTSFDDIFNIINLASKKIPLDQIAMQKYAVCGVGQKLHGSGGFNNTEMEKIPHKFEGAMLKFTQALINDKVYRLYTESMIWDTNNRDNRDL